MMREDERQVCIVILSDKSTGSSVLQRELLKAKGVHVVSYTRHFENETLFWNKAVAVLGLPQTDVLYSELPMDKAFASRDLNDFMRNNVSTWKRVSNWHKQDVFDAWERLCQEYGPFFLEKSPHHLQYQSALELLDEWSSNSVIEIKYIGLIRNPMDALYSSWRRWNANPHANQYSWYHSYSNLTGFAKHKKNALYCVKYEDLVSNPDKIKDICRFIGLKAVESVGEKLHKNALHKWRSNRFYGFQLDEEVRKLALELGYQPTELENTRAALWPIYRVLFEFQNSDFAKRIKQITKFLIRK